MTSKPSKGQPSTLGRIQSLALEQTKANLAAGRLRLVQQASDADLKSLGIRVDWDDTANRLALARIARAQARAFQKNVERGQGKPHDTRPSTRAPEAL